jgi:hypothetical protein
MSTKIHNGYALPKMSAYQLGEFIKALRVKLLPIAKRIIFAQIASDTAEAIDEITINKIEKNRFLWDLKLTEEQREEIRFDYPVVGQAARVSEWLYENIKKTSQRNPSYDFQFSACFFPMKDKVLALVYHEQKLLKIAWERMKGVRDYSYWDHSDKPDEVTSKEWNARIRNWDKAIESGGARVPADNGLTWELLSDSFMFMCIRDGKLKDEVLKYIPSPLTRAERLARGKIMTAKMEEYRTKHHIVKNADTSLSDSGYFFAEGYLRSAEGKAHLEKYAVELSKTLLEINAETLEFGYNYLITLSK